MNTDGMIPSQQSLLFPLLESLQAEGGRARSKALCDRVAKAVGVPDDVRSRKVFAGKAAGEINAFDRNVRWSQQRAKALGLAEPIGDGMWRLTGKGRHALREAKPGIVVTAFTTDSGIALFGRAEEAMQYVDDGSVQLVLTSPPYALVRQKEYGNVDERRYVDWLLKIMEAWPRKLTSDGSIVLNLMDTWREGSPTVSLYQERILIALDDAGIKLAQRFQWHNPSKLPAPAEYVTVRKCRVKPALEQVYWLSPHTEPFADTSQVLKPYSESMKALLQRGGERAASRPSGYEMKAGGFAQDNGGALPDNLLSIANTESNSAYIAGCKEAGLPVHPARFPGALAAFFIKMLTRAGDVVMDPFGGSGTTAAEAEKLGRRWITVEMILDYIMGHRLRFSQRSLQF
jgi:DNA modification methylase